MNEFFLKIIEANLVQHSELVTQIIRPNHNIKGKLKKKITT
jgi:hypothetical protein